MTDSSKPNHPILVADTDPNFIVANFHSVTLVESRTILVDNETTALRILTDRSQLLSGIFVNPAVGFPTWLHILKGAHQHRPGLPIFLIDSGQMPALKEEDLAKLGIQQIVPKPISYEELRMILLESDVGFHPYALQELARRSEDTVKLEHESTDAGFLPIRIEHIIASKKSFFDLYLRLSPTKYVKVLRFGDALSEERILRYLEQGTTHLFLRREAQEHYLAFCDLIASRALLNDRTPTNMQASRTLNYGEQTIRFLEKHGVNNMSLSYARKYVEKVHSLVGKLAQNNGYLQELMRNVALYDHSASTAIVAGLMVEKIGIKSNQVFESSGLAVLLHDIGLIESSEAVRRENIAMMSEKEKLEYYGHPDRGAKILATFAEFPRAVIDAVQQHHLRPHFATSSSKGFALKTVSKDASINRLAELIGVSDEFTQLIFDSEKDPSIDPLHVMHHHRLKEFSEPVAAVFRSTFLFDE